MATRRRNNKRHRRRRGRFGFLYKALSLVLILAAVLAGCMVFFRVNEVLVTGEAKYTADQVVEVSGIQMGDSLLLLGKNQIVQRLRMGLPYVESVAIRQRLPDTVVLAITETTPVAVVKGDDGGWWIINGKCKLLERVSSPAQAGLATVTGLTALLPAAGTKLAVDETREGQGVKLDSLSQLLAALTERNMSDKVSSIDMTAIARISIRYDDRITVVLPMVDDFSVKLMALEKTMGKLQENERGTLDLTNSVGERWSFTPE